MLGARTVRVQQAMEAAKDVEVHAREVLSDVEDVDIAQAIVQMQAQEVAYQAALSAPAKMAQMPTLFELAW